MWRAHCRRTGPIPGRDLRSTGGNEVRRAGGDLAHALTCRGNRLGIVPPAPLVARRIGGVPFRRLSPLPPGGRRNAGPVPCECVLGGRDGAASAEPGRFGAYRWLGECL